jgi:hypothetical protein
VVKVPAPNRIAVYLASAAALLGGLAPAVADLDTASTVGVLGGVIAVVGVVRKWLEGWQSFEERVDLLPLAGDE